MKYNLIIPMLCLLMLGILAPSAQAAVGVKGQKVKKELTEKKEKRLNKLKKKLKKKIDKKRAKAKKKGKAMGDVMESRNFILGLIFLGGGLALALLAGLFGIQVLGWVAGLVAVVGVVLMILGILETV